MKKAKKEKKRAHVFKNYAPTYNAEILNCFNPEPQLKNNELRGIKFVIALVFILKNNNNNNNNKRGKDKTNDSIYSTIMTKIWKYEVEGSGWTTDSMIQQNINVSKYKLLSDTNYIILPKELYNSQKGLKCSKY